MFDYIRFRIRLARLLRDRRAVIALMPQPQPGQEFQLRESDQLQLDVAEHLIYRLTTDYYWEQSLKLNLPIPGGNEYWEDSKAYPGTGHLSRGGLSLVRSAIREERKYRSEAYALWITGLTGLLGTLTGLISVIADKG